MAIKETTQYPVYIYARVALADLPLATPVEVAKVPQGAVITDVQAIVDTAFDSGTTATLDVGFAADPNALLAAANIAAAGVLAAAATADDLVEFGIDDVAILAERSETGAAATVGSLRLIIGYIVDGRAHENSE